MEDLKASFLDTRTQMKSELDWTEKQISVLINA